MENTKQINMVEQKDEQIMKSGQMEGKKKMYNLGDIDKVEDKQDRVESKYEDR